MLESPKYPPWWQSWRKLWEHSSPSSEDGTTLPPKAVITGHWKCICHFVKVLLPPKTRQTHLSLKGSSTLVIVRQCCSVTKTCLVCRRRISWALLSSYLPPTSSVLPSLNPPAVPGLHCLLLVVLLLLREHVLGYLLWNTPHRVRCSECRLDRAGGRNETAARRLCILRNWNLLMFPSCWSCRVVQQISLKPTQVVYSSSDTLTGYIFTSIVPVRSLRNTKWYRYAIHLWRPH